MTRDEFIRQMRALMGTRKDLILRNGKRLRLRALQECLAAPDRLHIAPDFKKVHEFEYDEIVELRPVKARPRRKASG